MPKSGTPRWFCRALAAALTSAMVASMTGCGWHFWPESDPFVFLDQPDFSPVAQAPRYGASLSQPRPATTSYDAAGAEYGGPSAASTPEEFTIEQALLFTLDNHPRLRARAEQVEVARAALITAGLCPNPQLVVDTDAPINESGPVELSGRLVFTFPTGGKRDWAAAAAKAGIAQAEWAIDSESHLLLVETADAALQLLYLQELVKMERELTVLAEDAAKLQRARVEGGGARAGQALAAEIDAVEIEFDSLNNEALVEAARVRLSKALGLPRPQELRIRGALAVSPTNKPALDDLLAEVAQIRPELAQAEATLEKSRRSVAAAQASAIPDIQLGPRYNTELGEQRDKLGVRFGMDLPWFDRKQGDIYEAASQSRVDEARRDEVRMTSLHDVANAYLQLRPIEAALAQYQQRMAPLVRQTEELLHDPEALLALDPVAVSDQLRRLVQVRLKHLKLRYQHNVIRTQLELLLGRRLDSGAAARDEAELLPPGIEAKPPTDNDRGALNRSSEKGTEDGAVLPTEKLPQSQNNAHGRRSPQDVAAEAAEFLDASNWMPGDKARGGRFRR